MRARIVATRSETPAQTKIAAGMPAIRPAARLRISGVASVCGAKPPVWATIRPRMTLSTPRVKIIDGMRRTATPKPLKSPMARPTARPVGIAQWPPTVVAIIAAAVRVQGTERSIWPSRITIIMPAATMPRKAPICSCWSR